MREMWTLGSQISSWPSNVFISYCHVPCMLTLGSWKTRCSIIPRSSRGDWELIKKNKWLILWSVYPWNVEMLMSEHLPKMFLINIWFRDPVKISRKLIFIKSNNMLIKFKSGLYAGLSHFTYQSPSADFSWPRGLEKMGKEPFHCILDHRTRRFSAWPLLGIRSYPDHRTGSAFTCITSVYEKSKLNWYL